MIKNNEKNNDFRKVQMNTIASSLGLEDRIVKNKYISGRSNSITGLGSDALLDESVSGDQIANDTITSDNIADDSVTPDELSPDYVTGKLTTAWTSAASATWQDTGFDITLPTIGVWVLMYNLRVNNPAAVNAFSILRLYNETTAAVVTDSHRISSFPTNAAQNTIPLSEIIVTTTVNNVIRVEYNPAIAVAGGLNADVNGVNGVIAWRIG